VEPEQLDPVQGVTLGMAVIVAYQQLRDLAEAASHLADALEAAGRTELGAALLRDLQQISARLDQASELVPGVKEATAAAAAGLESVPDAGQED
jgi:hypothetical protein